MSLFFVDTRAPIDGIVILWIKAALSGSRRKPSGMLSVYSVSNCLNFK